MWRDILGSVQIGTKVICNPGKFPTWECELEFPEGSAGEGQWVRMGAGMSYSEGTQSGVHPLAARATQVFSHC